MMMATTRTINRTTDPAHTTIIHINDELFCGPSASVSSVVVPPEVNTMVVFIILLFGSISEFLLDNNLFHGFTINTNYELSTF